MLITLKFWKWVTPKNVSFVILMLQFCVIFGQQKVIIIDPGHGGKDTGAIGTNSIQEKDVSLSIAKEIIRLNETLLNNEFDMYSTRYMDTLISLSDRSRLAESLKADVFVSLHCNASNTSAKGMDIYVHNTNDEEVLIKKSIGMGLSILEESTLKLDFKKRAVRFANFQVLRENIEIRPAILIEMGFISSTDEADYFLKPKNIRAMALAILMGLYNYLNVGL
ncbi:N-acetylmuramoyl-L-alanine amidase [Mesonia ostreae]|jgi:N-acetylmuramoyl-L-alanine amidase|uniref:N-acetylmuramoyl-L-alanine amidase n=4 Tax=Flavobacteriales TaxID=200644 RepID=A0ABU2KI54_9FLAO|nr:MULTISPECIES: N-acetylmuramoyl-L-alanine amidase [Flavobacteriaceae]MBW4970808.1 N-acetylmuramoyl-L-alanine amidase [Croceibacter atlanticus]PXX28201.1 N-acetylmuramoyl-L-alanine amidase [Arenibacter sp. ARW7G5Y1]TVZ47134.1 N-acetylmuramoyl-L-alanine amidase [Olleya sp. Hel_I_94]TXK72084.1 N-acetylmuramoyl-L-alanine amidase [Mesonia sp. K4-1]HIC30494.1 N-acetylmuramoyl-L-alanine amidase [Flavobacteriaceae bacterium]|tara:strand:- start:203 stop:868 length:666 start_codon:yes stop_codon:yes gene_type:complete